MAAWPFRGGIVGFFVAALVWFVALTLAWMQVSAWTSHPAAALAHIALGNGAKQWVRTVHKEPGHLEVDTRIPVPLASRTPGLGVAELVAETDTARYGYGLPLYLALLLAARNGRFVPKALAGYLILLLPQAFSLTFAILKQIIATGGTPGALGVAPWQLEAVALGYQFGSLLLPTLAPVAIWLWLDRSFLSSVVLAGWLERSADNDGHART